MATKVKMASSEPTAKAPLTTLPREYSEIVIKGERKSSRVIEVSVLSSPIGKMDTTVSIYFSENEGRHIRNSFYSQFDKYPHGRAKITQSEATDIGKQLTKVLFPPIIFEYFSKSLSRVVRTRQGGLRIRLVMDETLVDLPWEYLYRPDRFDEEGVSGFLLLDSYVSIVRQSVNDRLSSEPVKGAQELAFVGTLWDGGRDLWEVKKEFELLRNALKPVSDFITPDFTITSTALTNDSQFSNASIFHYAGHCDFDFLGSSFIIHEMPGSGQIQSAKKTYLREIAEKVGSASQIRLIVLSACNSGFWPVIRPLLETDTSAIIGINGIVSNQSTIEFCGKLYESLAIGLSLDEAVNHARLHLLKFNESNNMFDWGLFMVYMPSSQAVIFPRSQSAKTKSVQKHTRKKHEVVVSNAVNLVKDLDGLNFGEIMSECSKRRVLILGRFTDMRLKILEEIEACLIKHKNRYIPQLFTFQKPEGRGLTESIIGFAAFSKFIIVDLSEPKSVPAELQAIVPNFLSVPVVPIIVSGETEFANFDDIKRRENVIKPTIQYNNLKDLLEKLDKIVIPKAEAKLSALQTQ